MRALSLKLCSVACAAALLAGCATGRGTPNGGAPMTDLQAREFQTRTLEVTDSQLAMNAVVNALQDDHYVIQQANAELGLLTARRDSDADSDEMKKSDHHWLGIAVGAVIVAGVVALLIWGSGHGHYHDAGPMIAAQAVSGSAPVATLFESECSVHLTPLPGGTQIRVLFARRVIDSHGNVCKAETVLEPGYYRTFFEKVDKSLFLARQGV